MIRGQVQFCFPSHLIHTQTSIEHYPICKNKCYKQLLDTEVELILVLCINDNGTAVHCWKDATSSGSSENIVSSS